MIGDKLQNSFDNAKYFFRCFSGAKTQDSHHIIQSLLKEKPDFAVIHVGSNITHRIFQDFNLDKCQIK